MGQVGTLALGIVGGVLGAFVGMPELGFMAGSLLGSAIFGSTGGTKGGPKLADLHVTSSAYGSPIIWGWGTCRVGGNVIWSYPLTQHEHSSGGKGGGGTYTYSWTGSVAICSTEFTGPIDKVLKIWADTKLVYDATGESGLSKNIPGSGGGKGSGGAHNLPNSSVINGDVTAAFNKVGKFRVYQGTQTQLPDPALEALVGTANAQAHRGTAHIVFEDVDLTNYGQRVPNWTFEVAFTTSTVAQNSFAFTLDQSVLTSTVQTGNAALDSFRQRAIFLCNGGGTADTKGFISCSLATGNTVLTSSFTRTSNGNSARAYIEQGMVVADDGYLYVWSAEANYGPICKIDPDTLLEVGHIGTANSFASVDGSTTFPEWVVPLKLSGANCLFVEGAVFRDTHLYDLDALVELAHGTYTSGHQMRLCGGNQVDTDNAQVIGLDFPSSGSASLCTLWNFNLAGSGAGGGAAITPTKIIDINASDIDSEWSDITGVTTLIFDATDGNVMFFVATNNPSVTTGHAQQYLIKVSTTDGSILWKLDYANTALHSESLPYPADYGSYQSVVSSGIFGFLDTHNNLWSVNTQDGTYTKSSWATVTLVLGTAIWNDTLSALMYYGDQDGTWSNRWGVIFASQVGAGVEVSVPVSQICKAVGYNVSTDIDVTPLTDIVEGYVLTNQMTGKDAIVPLSQAFTFDAAESDNKLKFVKRGGSSVRTLPSDDFALVDPKVGLYVQEQRTQELDIPSQISINFLDPNHNYQQATQYARRVGNPYPTMFSKQVHTESMALVAEPGFMKQLAEKLLFTYWMERVSYKTKTHWGNIDLDPTDIVTITLPDESIVPVRLIQDSVGADLTLEHESLSESGPTYSSYATTDGGLGFNQQQLVLPVTTKLFLLDVPLLRDTDDTGQSYTILYDAASGYGSSGWSGTQLWKSSDNTNFTDEGAFQTSQQAAWGSSVNALGDTDSPFVIDNVNTLTVQMVTGGSSLASDTLANVCNGANVGVLMNQANNTLEIIQWLTNTTNADGSHTLSGLLRGRRGTEVYTGGHAIGDIFVVLTTATLQSLKMALGDLNIPRYFKPVSTGTLFADVDSKPFTDTGRTLKPYAPVQVTATVSGSDIDLGWVRRTRVGGELMPFTGVVPLSEQFESYEVDIYNALGDTVLRTLRVDYGAGPTSNPGVTYAAADIATDFGSTPTSLNLAVYQISAVAGRGFGKLQTVAVN